MAGSTHEPIETAKYCSIIDWNRQDARSIISHLQAEPIEPAARVRVSHCHSSIHAASKKHECVHHWCFRQLTSEFDLLSHDRSQ
jgi:hypothetical protein